MPFTTDLQQATRVRQIFRCLCCCKATLVDIGGRLESRRGFDSLQPHILSQQLTKNELLVLPGRPFLNSPSEGIEPAICAKSFAVIFDQLMCFLICSPLFLFGLRFRKLDVIKRPPLSKKLQTAWP